MATTAAGPSRLSRLFYINDKSSGLRFLVDTGAEVSVIPPLRRHRLKPSLFSLQAANSTTISTYGQRSLTLDLGLRRRFHWVFMEANVKSPIIGADFLSSFGLTVDVRHRRLSDTTTQLFTIEVWKQGFPERQENADDTRNHPFGRPDRRRVIS
nr:unnamed protein product [Spirometra erinaceieuropaei]